MHQHYFKDNVNTTYALDCRASFDIICQSLR